GRLVKQQQLWSRRERAHNLESSLRAVRQTRATFVTDARQIEDLEQLETVLTMLLLVSIKPRRAQHCVNQSLAHVNVTGRHHVFQHRHAWKQSNVLERARDAACGDLIRTQAVNALTIEVDRA